MRIDHAGIARPLALAALFSIYPLCAPAPLWAQNYTPDPYRPYNGMYDPFVFSTFPNGLGYTPNQDVLTNGSGITRANQFQSYLNQLDGFGTEEQREGYLRRGRAGVPYYQAFRQYDAEYNRVYRPNAEADKSYNDSQKRRHEKYLSYLKETNPRKRAQLYREYAQESLRASRALDVPRTVSPARGGRSSAPTPSASGTSAATLRGAARTTPSATPAPASGARGSASPADVLRRSQELSTGRSGTTTPRPSGSAARP